MDVDCLDVMLYREDWAIVPDGDIIVKLPGLAPYSRFIRQLVPLEEAIPV
jgi:hypothetical protein